jgi:hypothetical protein
MLAFRRPARLLWRPRRPAALISAGGLLAAALLGSLAPPAGAAAPAVAFHGYSVFEIHLSGVVSSLSVTRPDEALHIAGTTGCKVKFHGTPAYQTEWIGDEAGNWLELGTGHQCQGYQYWYAGFGSNGTWFPQWTKVTSTEGSHRFWIHGTNTPSGKSFTFNIGAKRYATIVDNLSSSFGQTGLESYASATKVPAYSMTLLKYSNGFGSVWHPWSGTRTVAPATAPLCERIVSVTHVVSGENVACRATATATAVATSARRVTRTAPSRPANPGTRPAASTRASAAACQRAARTWGAAAVTRSYQDTAGTVRAWREARSPGVRAAYPLSSPTAAAPVAVCYLSGSFAGIPAAPGYAGSYRRLIVIVSESTGGLTLDAAGHAATWAFGPPPAP